MIEGTMLPSAGGERGRPPSNPHDDPKPSQLTQSHKWWTSKVGPLLGVAYLALTLFPVSSGTAAIRMVAMLWSACLLASVAYVVNDWSDRESDRLAGKKSIAMDMAPATAAVLMTVPVALATVPWWVIGLPAAGWVMLAAIAILPHLYSDRPFRWKERGSLGLIADALLAHVCPTVFALAAFDALHMDLGFAKGLVVVAVIAWSCVVGGRGIIDHQLNDLHDDRKAGTTTWVLSVGVVPARELAGQLLVVEILTLAVILGGLVATVPVAAALFGVTAVAAVLARMADVWTRPLPATGTGPVFGVLWVSYAFWFPFVLLIALVARQPALFPLLPLHIVLFRSVAWPWVRNVVGYGRSTTRIIAIGTLNLFRYRVRGWLVRILNWVRYRLPDYFRRAWYHGLRPAGRQVNMRTRHRVETLHAPEVHPVQNIRRQRRRAGRVWHRMRNRLHRAVR